MGMIDLQQKPTSDLYRYAGPADTTRRLAAEDLAAASRYAEAKRRPPTPPAEVLPEIPEPERTLSLKEWVGKVYPELAHKRYGTKSEIASITGQYRDYLATRGERMRERYAKFEAQLRLAELRDRANRWQSERADRKSERADRSKLGWAELEQRSAAASRPKQATPGSLSGMLGQAILSDESKTPEDQRTALRELFEMQYGSRGRAGEPKNLLPTKNLAESMFGVGGVIPGWVQKMQENPVAGWIEGKRDWESRKPFYAQAAPGVAELLESNAPTPAQVYEALSAKAIEPDDVRELVTQEDLVAAFKAGELAKEQVLALLQLIASPADYARFEAAYRQGSGSGVEEKRPARALPYLGTQKY